MIYIILGMHKSGTTLISQTLHRSNINMGDFDEKISYYQGNQYERLESIEINQQILSSHNKNSIDIVNTNNDLKNDDSIQLLIHDFIQDLNNKYENWGFKDPRTTLSFSIWKQYLNDYKIIAVYRNPVEVWNHYRKNIPNRKFIKKFTKGLKALIAWYTYNEQMLNDLKHVSADKIVIDYASFLESDQEFLMLKKLTETELVDARDLKQRTAKKTNKFLFKIQKLVCKLFFSKDIDALIRDLDVFKSINNKSIG